MSSVYIGQTKRSVNTRLSEHKRHCRLGQTEKSAVAEHALLPGHDITFNKTEVLSTTKHFHSRLHMEAIEIHKHRKNIFNRKEEMSRLNKTWHLALQNTIEKHSGINKEPQAISILTTPSVASVDNGRRPVTQVSNSVQTRFSRSARNITAEDGHRRSGRRTR